MKMTVEEKQARNAAICERYLAGVSLAECGRPYGITRARVKQIVQEAGLWRQRSTDGREAFLGINISEDDKDALLVAAARTNTSMSALGSEWIREKLAALDPPLTHDEKVAFFESRIKQSREHLAALESQVPQQEQAS